MNWNWIDRVPEVIKKAPITRDMTEKDHIKYGFLLYTTKAPNNPFIIAKNPEKRLNSPIVALE